MLATVPNLTVLALAPNLRGVQNAYHAGAHKIRIPVLVSEGHRRANLDRTPAQSVAMMREIMQWLKAQPRRVPVVAGASTAFGCSIDGVASTAQTVAPCQGLADAGGADARAAVESRHSPHLPQGGVAASSRGGMHRKTPPPTRGGGASCVRRPSLRATPPPNPLPQGEGEKRSPPHVCYGAVPRKHVRCSTRA